MSFAAWRASGGAWGGEGMQLGLSHSTLEYFYSYGLCGVVLVARSGAAAAAAADLRGRPDIVHCVRGSPSRPPAGCGNVQDSDDDGARKQRGDRCRGCPAAAVKPFCMHDRGKFDSQSKIQSGSAFLSNWDSQWQL